MALFVIERVTPLAPSEAWRRMTDWERHGGSVPLTRITVSATAPPQGQGALVLARTGVGRVGFDDPMRITVWQPERHCRLEKTGRTVTGWAEIDVRPDPRGGPGSVVRWREDLRVRGVPGALDAVTAQVARRVFGRVVDSLLKT